ncbi:MAG: hypothetical protein ACK5VW_01130 [Holosporales bacterium]
MQKPLNFALLFSTFLVSSPIYASDIGDDQEHAGATQESTASLGDLEWEFSNLSLVSPLVQSSGVVVEQESAGATQEATTSVGDLEWEFANLSLVSPLVQSSGVVVEQESAGATQEATASLGDLERQFSNLALVSSPVHASGAVVEQESTQTTVNITGKISKHPLIKRFEASIQRVFAHMVGEMTLNRAAKPKDHDISDLDRKTIQAALSDIMQKDGFLMLSKTSSLRGYLPENFERWLIDSLLDANPEDVKRLFSSIFPGQPWSDEQKDLAYAHVLAVLPSGNFLLPKGVSEESATSTWKRVIPLFEAYFRDASKQQPFFAFGMSDEDLNRLKAQPHTIVVRDDQLADKTLKSKLETLLATRPDHKMILNILGKRYVTDDGCLTLSASQLPAHLSHLALVNPNRSINRTVRGFLADSKLVSLDLGGLTNLRILMQDFMVGSENLTTLKIRGLPSLAKIEPGFLQKARNLQSVILADLPGLSEIQRNPLNACPVLQSVTLRNLPQLKGVDCNAFKDSLQISSLTIEKCPNLKIYDFLEFIKPNPSQLSEEVKKKTAPYRR